MAITINRASITGGLAMCLLAAGVSVLPTAQATMYSNRAVSSVCKAAFGAGADLFYFDAEYAQNIGAGTNYLTCGIEDIGDGTNESVGSILLHAQNPTAAAKTITCVVVLTHTGTDRVFASTNVNVPANTGASHVNEGLSLTGLTRSSVDQFYTMSCSIPSQVKFNNFYTTTPGNLAA